MKSYANLLASKISAGDKFDLMGDFITTETSSDLNFSLARLSSSALPVKGFQFTIKYLLTVHEMIMLAFGFCFFFFFFFLLFFEHVKPGFFFFKDKNEPQHHSNHMLEFLSEHLPRSDLLCFQD